MTRTKQDFEMYSGNHKNVTFTVKNSAGASVNLAGASVVWALMATPNSASLLKRSTDSGCGITVSGCTFTVALSPNDTFQLAGDYFHESYVRDSEGDVSTVAVGAAKIVYTAAS